MLRFVILEHDHPERHWDLMLEVGPMLRSWRLAAPPEAPGTVIAALAVQDHRADYLDYEGPVSGDRGTVALGRGRLHGSTWRPTGGLVQLEGRRVHGLVRLEPMAADRWQFVWRG